MSDKRGGKPGVEVGRSMQRIEFQTNKWNRERTRVLNLMWRWEKGGGRTEHLVSQPSQRNVQEKEHNFFQPFGKKSGELQIITQIVIKKKRGKSKGFTVVVSSRERGRRKTKLKDLLTGRSRFGYRKSLLSVHKQRERG